MHRRWHPSHSLDMPNALLAATAIRTARHIFTLNRKHYPMPDVVVKKAW